MVPEVPLLVALLLLLLLLPGNRWIKSLMAYLPGACGEKERKGQKNIGLILFSAHPVYSQFCWKHLERLF